MNYMKKTKLTLILIGIVVAFAGLTYFDNYNIKISIEKDRNGNTAMAKTTLQENPFEKGAEKDFKKGHEFLREKNLDKALDAFKKAAETSPKTPAAHYWVGMTYFYKKENERAIAKFKKVLELDPKNYRSFWMIGKILSFDKTKLDEALKYLNQAIAINPEFADAHFDIGRIYLVRGDAKRAMAEFGMVFRTEPTYAAYHYEMGIIFERMKAPDRARKEYERALQLNPNFTRAKDALKKLK